MPTATAEVLATRARCPQRGVIVPTGIGPRATPWPPNQDAPAHGPIVPHHALASLGHAVQGGCPRSSFGGGEEPWQAKSWDGSSIALPERSPKAWLIRGSGCSSGAHTLSKCLLFYHLILSYRNSLTYLFPFCHTLHPIRTTGG